MSSQKKDGKSPLPEPVSSASGSGKRQPLPSGSPTPRTQPAATQVAGPSREKGEKPAQAADSDTGPASVLTPDELARYSTAQVIALEATGVARLAVDLINLAQTFGLGITAERPLCIREEAAGGRRTCSSIDSGAGHHQPPIVL